MKNNFKKILIGIVFAMALLLPLQIPTNATSNHLNQNVSAMTKEPTSKKKIAFKFIMAMIGVAASSTVIYVGLTIYNKIFKSEPVSAVGLNSLRTPGNFKESINIFIQKTKWD